MDEQLNKIADTGAEALNEVKQKFVDADIAFIRASEKRGISLVGAFMALTAIHRAAADQMEIKLAEVIGSATQGDDELTTDEEE